ncbi:MAG TPA: ferritin-like domain-containing protein [Vicinamibacterales bacterium]|jgi:ferritin-like metal-binding protein YciE|nr:ferritin-like domain-containing protein [Vicinamibacterales bacterium]
MPAKSLQELFVEELRDAYDGEKRLTKALPKMAKAAESPELRSAFTSHLRETERHVQRLEQVFRTIGEPVRGKKCDGLMGIIEEGKSAIEELEGSVLDAALIAGGQRAEHYEIAAYGTLAYFAELLGHDKAKDLLGQTLEEEKAADEKLTTIAKSKVNRAALMGAGTEDDFEAPMSRSARGGARRMVASMRGGSRTGTRAMAHDRSRGGVRGNAGGRRRTS